jgi:hypothetical protein
VSKPSLKDFNNDDATRRLKVEKSDLVKENKSLQRQIVSTEKELLKTQAELSMVQEIKMTAKDRNVSPFRMPPKREARQHATPIFVSSDLQAGEVVIPDAMHGFNAYDLAIAKMRFQFAAEEVVRKTYEDMPQYIYDGIAVPLNGDPVSGNIHEELQETNQGTVLETVLFAYEVHVAMFDLFLEAFPKVLGIATPSNHGRTHKKTPHKQQARNSYDWLIAKMLQDRYRNDERIQFIVSDASDAQFKVYDKTYSVEHGHAVKGYGDGVAGIMPAMARATLKRNGRDQLMGRPADHYIYSHYHQLTFGPTWTLNGSYVGYTEYPYDLALKPEGPQQGLLLAVPEHGVELRQPIRCEAPGERKLWKTAGRNSW